MSQHIFTVQVECDDSEDYEQTVMALSGIGEILDETSDFSG